MNNCPRCGGELDCLAGESAHPDNWYCTDESCGYKAWDTRRQAVSAIKTYTEAEHQAAIAEAKVELLDDVMEKCRKHPLTKGTSLYGMESVINTLKSEITSGGAS